MRADILLADSAQSVNGKAYLLGAGWSVQQGPGPLAVVIFIEVGWDETDRRIPWQLTLEDADGSIVNLPGPAGPQPFQIAGEIEAGRAPGAAVGSPLTLPPLTVNLGPLSIEPGRYQF
ncbi:MAG TPA: hypothetical protein VJM33_12965, partial [Microthrixaceae bacterium]|nr:hypothetical protein [Microthrixaceae bacterium]